MLINISDNKLKKLIIVFLGGGLRGYASIRLIEMLIDVYPDLMKYVFLMSGTSVGSINAGGLASGLSVDEVKEFYLTHAEKIFKRSPLKALLRGRSPFGVFGSLYSSDPLREALDDMLEDKTMSDCIIDFMAVSYSLSRDRDKIFNYADSETLISDVCLRSSAIIPIFPLLRDHGGDWLDGGVQANNSVLYAITEAISKQKKYKRSQEDIYVLSIGTGTYDKKPINFKSTEVGFYGMAKKGGKLIDIGLSAKDETNSYMASQFIGDNYFHLDMETGKLPLDKVSTIKKIEDAINRGKAGVPLQNCKRWLEDVVEKGHNNHE